MESSFNQSPAEEKSPSGKSSGGVSADNQSNRRVGESRKGRPSWRSIWVVIHRYTGLTIATFLVVAGLTGSALAFYKELDGLINPGLIRVTPASPEAVPMEPLALRARAMEQIPGWSIDTLVLSHDPGYSTVFWQELETGGWRSVYVDPYTGEVLGFRSGSDLTKGIEYLMPFIYRLHYELALGKMGELLFGIVALLWTIDCFVGFYLTLPVRKKRGGSGEKKSSRSWLSRWKPSWLIKGGSLFRSMFTFHRASGLWVWPLLFVFAWSAVGFNLGEAYYPVMKLFGSGPDVRSKIPHLEEPIDHPKIGWEGALLQARALMNEESKDRDFSISKEGWLSYDPSHGTYLYRVHSSLDVGQTYPGTRIWFDGNDGKLIGFYSPTGIAAGDTMSGWLFALHMASVGGLPYRIFVCVLGFVIAGLSVTGVYIWWKKFRARRSQALA